MNPCLARRHKLPLCKGKLAPLGRTQLRMLDEGICELLVFTCTKCMRIHLERPSVTTKRVDNYDPSKPELRMQINPQQYLDG